MPFLKAQELEDFDKESKQASFQSSKAISEAHSAAVEVLCRNQDRAILNYLSELKEHGKEVSLLIVTNFAGKGFFCNIAF